MKKQKEKEKSRLHTRKSERASTQISNSTDNTLTKLQQQLGNQAFSQLVNSQGSREPKINRPDDDAEKEANKVSKIVSRIHEQDTGIGAANDSQNLHQNIGEEFERSDPRTLNNRSEKRGRGEPLPTDLRSFYEPIFGKDLGNVQVHTGSRYASLTKALNARAFTYRNSIYFAPGEYRPTTPSGKELLAHELTHVIQQENDQVENGLIQRNEKDDELDMEFTLAETYEWSELVKGFKSHESEIRRAIHAELLNYAHFAQKGAEAGVNEIFAPHEDDLTWKGARATQLTGAMGALPEVGSILSGVFGGIIAEELAKENIKIRKLKSEILKKVGDRVDTLLRAEPTPFEKILSTLGILPPTPRERIFDYYVSKAAEQYIRLINEGIPSSDFASGDREFVNPESDDIKDELVDYVANLITANKVVETKFKDIIIEEYKPIVDDQFKPDFPESPFPGEPGYGPPSPHF